MATRQRSPVVAFPKPDTATSITRCTPLSDLPEMLTPLEVGVWLKLGRDAAYLFARQHGKRIGRRLLIPRRVLEEFAGRD